MLVRVQWELEWGKGENAKVGQHHLILVHEEPEKGSLQRRKDEADMWRTLKRFKMAS